MYTYILVLLLSLSVPVIRSFEKTHIHFAGKFRFLLPAMLITSAVFVAWDVMFTKWGVWGFNDDFVMGLYIFGLPLEEWLFFLVIPYVCLFSYEVLNYFVKRDFFKPAAIWLSIGMITLMCWLVIQHNNLIYPLWIGIFNIALIAFVGLAWRPVWLGRFYFMFFVILVPFLLVNGILTGSFFDRVIVWYNPETILNFRILTIPIEDLFYAFGMLLMTTALYEVFRKKGGKSPWPESES